MSERQAVMSSGRLEAFSDGVIAIIITIMVLELKVPHGDDFDALIPLIPVLLSYVLSFVYVGIYWNNHHHMLHASDAVTGRILWANLSVGILVAAARASDLSAGRAAVVHTRSANRKHADCRQAVIAVGPRAVVAGARLCDARRRAGNQRLGT